MSVRQRKWRDKKGRARSSWIVHIVFTHPDGTKQEVRRTSPVPTRRGAEQYERDVRAALLAGTYGKEAKPPTPTLAEFAPEFMENYVKVNNKHSTVLSKTAILKHHLVPFFGKIRLDAIGREAIDRYKKSRHGGWSPKTINNHLTVLRKLLTFAQDWEIIEHVPKIVWLKSPTPTFRFLDFDEARRFLAALDSGALWHTMVLVALNTGLRHGELRALRWCDVDLKAGRLYVRQSIARGVTGTPKGGRERHLDLNETALKSLRQHKHLRGPLVFCRDDGTTLGRNQGKRQLQHALRRSGIAHDKISWHVLRHTFASHLVMQGVQLKAVQEALGHTTIEMTMRYAHLSPAVRRAAVGRLDELYSTTAAHDLTEKANRAARLP